MAIHKLDLASRAPADLLPPFLPPSAFAAADTPAPALSAKKRFKQQEKHVSHKFEEGWVEFLDKRVARSVAEMLNANSIGGKKGSRWRDDVWTMKYLPRFRWDMLSEQVGKPQT